MEIKSNILKQGLVEWKKLVTIQNTNLKELTEDNFKKLKLSLINNSFVQPFNIWESDKLYCLDGYHRIKALESLEQEGVKIPAKLPANFVKCKDKKQASKLVLIYSSVFAFITNDGLYEHINLQNLNIEDFKSEINLPELDLNLFDIAYSPENKEKEVDEFVLETECPKCHYKW